MRLRQSCHSNLNLYLCHMPCSPTPTPLLHQLSLKKVSLAGTRTCLQQSPQPCPHLLKQRLWRHPGKTNALIAMAADPTGTMPAGANRAAMDVLTGALALMGAHRVAKVRLKAVVTVEAATAVATVVVTVLNAATGRNVATAHVNVLTCKPMASQPRATPTSMLTHSQST